MIKARGKLNGFETIFIGLEEENIRRLKNGEPILFAGDPIGISQNICIFVGATQKELLDMLGAAQRDLAGVKETGN